MSDRVYPSRQPKLPEVPALETWTISSRSWSQLTCKQLIQGLINLIQKTMDLMRTYLTNILVASMSCTLALCGHATTKIATVPFNITKPGKYLLETNLTLSGTNTAAITVNQSNVLIELNGFTLSTSTSGNTGISVSSSVTNVTIQDGTIAGFEFAIALQGSQQLVQNVRLFNATDGVFAINCTSSAIQDCFILGLGGASDIGVDLANCSNVDVANNYIAQVGDGCFSSGSTGGNSFIANHIANCTIGLDFQSGDKYQGNVATSCSTDFSEGIPVGQENG